MDKTNNQSRWKVGTYPSQRNSIEEKNQENIIYKNSNSSESTEKIKNSSHKEKNTTSSSAISNFKSSVSKTKDKIFEKIKNNDAINNINQSKIFEKLSVSNKKQKEIEKNQSKMRDAEFEYEDSEYSDNENIKAKKELGEIKNIKEQIADLEKKKYALENSNQDHQVSFRMDEFNEAIEMLNNKLNDL